MGVRYAESGGLDYCFSPKHVYKDGKHLLVPCQKCDGCLLHKANEWSRRISMECEKSVPLFFTLTYDNKYLPRLFPDLEKCHLYNSNECVHCTCKCYDGYHVIGWYSDHDLNFRNNSVCDVRRDDHIFIGDSVDYDLSVITNWDSYPTIQYCSKRDVQLFLKLIQKRIYERFSVYGTFRYFVIGELGPLTQRCHCHGILFFQSVEVASFVKECCIYQSWQMCDPNRLVPYLRLSDGRIGNYLSNYVTSLNRLPRVYSENKCLRPFRLASKDPAIGYISFSVSEIFEAIYRRTIEYVKPVEKLGTVYVLRYPKDLCSQIFPKAYRYAERTFSSLCYIYGCLYQQVRAGSSYRFLSFIGFSKGFRSLDWQATYKCYKILSRYGKELALTPWLYVFWLDQYYYLSAMYSLRIMYNYESNFDFTVQENKIRLFFIYSDITVVLNDRDSFTLEDLLPYARMLEYVGIDYSDLVDNPDFLVYLNSISHTYRCEIEDILINCEKVSKYKEKVGISPTF